MCLASCLRTTAAASSFQGKWPKVPFSAGANFESDYPYLLTDGIYPEWALFVKAFPQTPDQIKSKFSKLQEGARKDVERAFGVLRKRFAALRSPCMKKSYDKMCKMMDCMIHIHNFIIAWNQDHDRQDFVTVTENDLQAQEEEQAVLNPVEEEDETTEEANPVVGTEGIDRLLAFYDADAHHELRDGLVDHVRSMFAEE